MRTKHTFLHFHKFLFLLRLDFINQLERNLESELILTGVRELELDHVALRLGIVAGEVGDCPEVAAGEVELDSVEAPAVYERFGEVVGYGEVLQTHERCVFEPARIVAEVKLLANAGYVSNLTGSCPDVKHVGALVERSSLVGVAVEILVVVDHIFLGLEVEVGA